jgi:hypothetical protein
MKLGELKAAIRALDGAPHIQFVLFGQRWVVATQKGDLISQLDERFPGGKAAETGLHLHMHEGRGFLCRLDNCGVSLNGN